MGRLLPPQRVTTTCRGPRIATPATRTCRQGPPDCHPSDKDLSPGTPDCHPSDKDLSPGTPGGKTPLERIENRLNQTAGGRRHAIRIQLFPELVPP